MLLPLEETMDIYSKLNAEQREAVEAIEGPFLILAGAGTGKTRVVTFRIAHLIESGIPPEQILGLTFTNKAAAEMRERVQQQTRHGVLICTFHSLGARILRESIHHLGYKRDFTIYDEDDAEKVLKGCLGEFHGKQDVRTLRTLISRAKNNMQAPGDIDIGGMTDPVERSFPEVYRLYQDKLQEYNALDFDDLLYLTARLFKENADILRIYQNRWNFFLVDEYQDTNETQYHLLKLLASKSGNLFVVGDPDQSIYSWRGANIRNILNFKQDYPDAKVVRLEQNYRSHTHILQASNAVVCHNGARYEKNLWSDLGPGEKVKRFTGDNDRDEANFVASRIRLHKDEHQIPYSEMAIFYRTNAQSRVFEDYFLQHRIPYVIIGGISFYQRREIKDILAFLRMAHSGSDYVSFLRSINIPKRGLGETTIEKIRDCAAKEGHTIFGYCEALVGDQPLQNPLRLTAKQKEGLKQYVGIIHELRSIRATGRVEDVVMAAIMKTGYLEYLKEDKETAEERKENLDSLIAKAIEWEMTAEEPTLSAFLEELSLKSSADEADTTRERISLMSIHNSKGLEFSVVFVVGLEEELFPHINAARDSAGGMEEERRLCYVGMTRAKDHLYMCDVHVRYIWGVTRTQRPSRFLAEIPSKHVEFVRRRHTAAARSEEEPFSDEIQAPRQAPPPAKVVFNPEDIVFHKDFGVGVVKDRSETSVGLTYKVSFADGKVRTLVAKYAPLQRL